MNREKEKIAESIYPFDNSSEEEEEEEEECAENSDKNDEDNNSESESDDGIPSATAWGKKRSSYYSTDYVDKDFGGYDSDAQLADDEEKEALAIQQKLIAGLDEADFDLEAFQVASSTATTAMDEKVSVDISELGENERLKLLETESPEIMRIIGDIEELLKTTNVQINNSSHPSTNVIEEYNNTKLSISLHYCINAMFYMAMKAKRSSALYHPITKRMTSYQLLLQKLPGIDKLNTIDDFPVTSRKRASPITLNENQKRVRFENVEPEDDENDTSEDGDKEEEESTEDLLPDGKRAISRKIAQNKGLMPHRKKAYKNPRVKHRLKFRKAKIRRHGQVREPRTELSRYGGEISGIKAGVSKSIKLK